MFFIFPLLHQIVFLLFTLLPFSYHLFTIFSILTFFFFFPILLFMLSNLPPFLISFSLFSFLRWMGCVDGLNEFFRNSLFRSDNLLFLPGIRGIFFLLQVRHFSSFPAIVAVFEVFDSTDFTGEPSVGVGTCGQK